MMCYQALALDPLTVVLPSSVNASRKEIYIIMLVRPTPVEYTVSSSVCQCTRLSSSHNSSPGCQPLIGNAPFVFTPLRSCLLYPDRLRVQEVMDAVLQSASEERWVHVGDQAPT